MAEPVSTLAAILASLAKWVLSLLPGAAGAAISLKFLGAELSKSQKLTSFAVGFACAIYIGPAIIELFPSASGPRAQPAIEFLVGLFGLATARELFAEINDADIIGAIKRRYFGGEK
jgi:hypothetical protein